MRSSSELRNSGREDDSRLSSSWPGDGGMSGESCMFAMVWSA